MPELDPMAEVIEQMPEPSEFADSIEAPVTDDDPANAATGDGSDFTFSTPDSSPIGQPIPDQSDDIFNPELHVIDPKTGEPRRTATGKFRRKRGKRNAAASVVNGQSTDQTKMQNAIAAAQVSVAATFLAGQMAFGPEGAPLEGEPEQMQAAYQQFYYMSERPINIPPWVLVAMVSSSYIAKRMAMEKPRNRVMIGIDWIQIRVVSLYRWVFGV